MTKNIQERELLNDDAEVCAHLIGHATLLLPPCPVRLPGVTTHRLLDRCWPDITAGARRPRGHGHAGGLSSL